MTFEYYMTNVFIYKQFVNSVSLVYVEWEQPIGVKGVHVRELFTFISVNCWKGLCGQP